MKSTKALLHLLKNKAIAIALLLVLGTVYKNLPENHPVPFAELLYAVILVSSVSVLAPVMRFLVFNEASVYAESGKLDKDIASYSHFPPALVHYWIATIICYLTSLLCVSSLLSR